MKADLFRRRSYKRMKDIEFTLMRAYILRWKTYFGSEPESLVFVSWRSFWFKIVSFLLSTRFNRNSKAGCGGLAQANALLLFVQFHEFACAIREFSRNYVFHKSQRCNYYCCSHDHVGLSISQLGFFLRILKIRHLNTEQPLSRM